MLTYLKVRNLAIVEEFAIEPGAGLNVLTGETGAGKSLLIDSLELLSGARGSSEMIRTGSDKLSAEAVLQVPEGAVATLEEIGVETEPGSDGVELIVKRELTPAGRGRVFINGSPVSVRDLAAVMDAVLEIHGQNAAHGRVAGQSFRELLDEFGAHAPLRDAVHATWDAWKAASGQLAELEGAQRDRELRLDLLKYQIGEISGARLDPGEEEPLRGERALLANARELAEAAAGAFALIEDDENAATSQVARAIHLLQPLSRAIPDLARATTELQDALYRLQETARTVSDLAGSVRHDPGRLEEVEERLLLVDRMKKKYGGSISEILEHLGRIEDEYHRLDESVSNLAKLEQAEKTRFDEYWRASVRLSAARRKAARGFERAIQDELDDLAMERTKVRVAVDSIERAETDRPAGCSAQGIDRVDILVAPNRGEEPKPMARIASGGELSRIQLAIAAALFKASPRSAAATLVFDEIDAGIGGRVAEIVGRKLEELSARNQVICVTHLPQIACFGASHFHVWKEDDSGQTRARVQKLESDDERIAEIARMLGGAETGASALAHARELLAAARRSADAPVGDRAEARKR